MKLAVITDEISQDFEEAAILASEFGLSGLEIRSVWEKGPHELEDKDISEILRISKEYSMEICGISSPVFKCDLDNPEEVEQHFDILSSCVTLAQKTGAKLIRGFSFWAKDDFSSRFDDIVVQLKKAAETLEGTGLVFMLEFDPSVYAHNGNMAAQLVEAVCHPQLKLLWDPGNDIYITDEKPYPDGYNRVKDLMVHVHIKDALRTKDGEIVATPVGEGDVDYVGQFAALKQDGYSGWVVLETHYRLHETIEQELLDMPKGSAFSAGGYKASKICLEKLVQLAK